MTKQELKVFYASWSKVNKQYATLHKGGHIAFPEPLQKEIIVSLYDSSLKLNKKPKTYDFQGNVELKSSTTIKGCTPFKHNQNQCSRIIYMVIDTNITVYEINQNDVQIINQLISQGQTNISLSNHIGNATMKKII